MVKKNNNQSELLMETPADITPGIAGDPNATTPDIMDETPDKVSADMRKFNRSQAMVNLVVGNLKGITVITDAAGVDKAQLYLKEGASVEKAIDKKRLELSKPYRDQVDRINDYGKELIKPIAPELTRVKSVILAYHKAQSKEARIKMLIEAGYTHQPATETTVELYRDQFDHVFTISTIETLSDFGFSALMLQWAEDSRAANAKAVKELDKQLEGAQFFGDEAAAEQIKSRIEDVKSAAAPVVVAPVAAPSVKGLTKRWKFEVTDATQVPRAYLVVDDQLIRDAINGGARSIPGVRIYEEESISIR